MIAFKGSRLFSRKNEELQKQGYLFFRQIFKSIRSIILLWSVLVMSLNPSLYSSQIRPPPCNSLGTMARSSSLSPNLFIDGNFYFISAFIYKFITQRTIFYGFVCLCYKIWEVFFNQKIHSPFWKSVCLSLEESRGD